MIQFFPLNRAHRGYISSLRANLTNYEDPYQVYTDARSVIHNILNTDIILRLRIIICLNIIFYKFISDEEEITQTFYFCSAAERILSSFQIMSAINSGFAKIFNSIESFIRNGSVW